MRPGDASFDLRRGDWGSGILQGSRNIPVPVLIQSSVVHAILQGGLGATCATLSGHELAWCCVIVELPHHKGGLGIMSLTTSGMAAFYRVTAHLVSWLGSLPHASKWIDGQNLADPNTWNISALQTLKQLHGSLLTHYNCTEWAPPLAEDAPSLDAPAQGHDNDSAGPLSLPPLNLLASLRCHIRVQQDEENGETAARPSLPPQWQVTKHIKRG
jgi:hypothetical protein